MTINIALVFDRRHVAANLYEVSVAESNDVPIIIIELNLFLARTYFPRKPRSTAVVTLPSGPSTISLLLLNHLRNLSS